MTDNIEARVRELLSSEGFVRTTVSYFNEMLAADRAAHNGLYSDDGEELQRLVTAWDELEGTKVICEQNPKHQQVRQYCDEMFSKMIGLSDKLAARYDPD